MSMPDFFRSRLDQMIDLRHPLAVLSTRLPWASIEAAVAPKLAHPAKPTKRLIGEDLAGAFDGRISPPRPPETAHPPDGQLAVLEEQLQPQRRRIR